MFGIGSDAATWLVKFSMQPRYAGIGFSSAEAHEDFARASGLSGSLELEKPSSLRRGKGSDTETVNPEVEGAGGAAVRSLMLRLQDPEVGSSLCQQKLLRAQPK